MIPERLSPESSIAANAVIKTRARGLKLSPRSLNSKHRLPALKKSAPLVPPHYREPEREDILRTGLAPRRAQGGTVMVDYTTVSTVKAAKS